MKAFLIILGVLAICGGVLLMPGTLSSGVWFGAVVLGAVLFAISRIIALLEEISATLRYSNPQPDVSKSPSTFSMGGVYYVADPPTSTPEPAPSDDADIWPDVTTPALRREIICKAKDTGATHVMVRGLTYKVEFKK